MLFAHHQLSSNMVWTKGKVHLDMTNSSICTLIESAISNPGIYAEKCNNLILLCVFRYWKSAQNLNTDAVVDVV